MPHNGNGQEQPAKEHAPETPCAPKLDPVTRVVEADGLFVGLIFRSWVSNLRLQTETGLSRSFILFSPKQGAHP